MLVLGIQRSGNTFGQYPSPEGSGGWFGHAAVEDQLDMVRTTDIQILTDNFRKELSTGSWKIQDLRQGKLRLQDRQLLAITGGSIFRSVGMR
ncbi:MAG: hypothetical protein L0Y39_09325 [Methylococcaceae bacterium]|nr:hypothetical protein [Methylococcaceae bacterium]